MQSALGANSAQNRNTGNWVLSHFCVSGETEDHSGTNKGRGVDKPEQWHPNQKYAQKPENKPRNRKITQKPGEPGLKATRRPDLPLSMWRKHSKHVQASS